MNYTDLFRATPSSMSEVGSMYVKVVLSKAERMECVELRVSTAFCMQTNSAYRSTVSLLRGDQILQFCQHLEQSRGCVC